VGNTYIYACEDNAVLLIQAGEWPIVWEGKFERRKKRW